MSKNLRRAFVKARPIAQTIAAVVSAIAAILRILKSLGYSSPLRRRGPPPSGSLLFAARHSKPYTCISILTYRQRVVKTSPVLLAHPLAEGIKAACLYVLSSLTVPCVRSVLLDPVQKVCQFFERQLDDCRLDFCNTPIVDYTS
jgi:hypothetical protein